MKERLKQLVLRLWAGVKDFMTSLWPKFKQTRAYFFFKKWGTDIINFLVLASAYATLPEGSWVTVLVGLWVFVLLAYYIFWKLFGMEKLFPKDEDSEPPLP